MVVMEFVTSKYASKQISAYAWFKSMPAAALLIHKE